MLKQIIFSLVLFFSSNLLVAQNNDEWQLIKTADDVSAYYKKSTCNGQEVLTIKFVNNKDQNVKVSWSLWNGIEARVIPLQAKQTKEGACDSSPAFMLLDRVPQGLSVNDMNATITIQIQ